MRERVRFALAELTRELVAAEVAGRSNGGTPAEHLERSTSDAKRCSVCRRTLPLQQFNRDARAPDGYRYRCKSCIVCVRIAPIRLREGLVEVWAGSSPMVCV